MIILVIDVLRGLVINTSLLISASWLGCGLISRSHYRQWGFSDHLQTVLGTILLGVVLMEFPVPLVGGSFLDLRHVPPVVACMLSGPTAGIVAAVVLACYRLVIGGTGAVPGALGLLVVGLLASQLRRGVQCFGNTKRLVGPSVLVFAIAGTPRLMVSGMPFLHLASAVLMLLFFEVAGTALMSRMIGGRLDSLQKERLTQRLAFTDHLTGLLNARSLENVLNTRNIGGRACLLILDVDHFKGVNDRYGHSTGDEVLRKCAQAITSALRSDDFVFRYGGEEFVILLEDCDEAAAWTVSERVRIAVAEAMVTAPDGSAIHVTVSGGLTELSPRDSVKGQLDRADALLYRAKAHGRNRIMTDPRRSMSNLSSVLGMP